MSVTVVACPFNSVAKIILLDKGWCYSRLGFVSDCSFDCDYVSHGLEQEISTKHEVVSLMRYLHHRMIATAWNRASFPCSFNYSFQPFASCTPRFLGPLLLLLHSWGPQLATIRLAVEDNWSSVLLCLYKARCRHCGCFTFPSCPHISWTAWGSDDWLKHRFVWQGVVPGFARKMVLYAVFEKHCKIL